MYESDGTKHVKERERESDWIIVYVIEIGVSACKTKSSLVH